MGKKVQENIVILNFIENESSELNMKERLIISITINMNTHLS